MDDFTIRPATNGDADAIRTLVFGILREFGFSPDPTGTDADLADLESSYQRGGAFDVLTDAGGRIVGTVGLFPLSVVCANCGRCTSCPDLRGRGLGGGLLRHAVSRARELGFTRIELETATVLETARRMYESFGFRSFTPHRVTCRCDRAYYLELAERG